jgi:RNA polymerase sigma-70 factor, ECF subfamily
MSADDDEAALLQAALAGDADAFGQVIAPYRRELLLYGYRLLGSLQDAEDLTQEVSVRAWTRLGTFEGRASFRAWLFRIATNLGFDLLRQRPRRSLPHLRVPPATPAEPQPPPASEPLWLEPLPDTLLLDADAESEPETQAMRRESVTLAFLVVLQALPARQRAILVLRDVLDWSAREVAEVLGMSSTAVESALQRARVTLRQRYHPRGSEAIARSTIDPATEDTLRRYIAAWEAADIAGLVALLREDATLSMPPFPWWFRGRATILAFITAKWTGGAPPAWRLVPSAANAQPAYVAYRLVEPGRYRMDNISLLTVEAGRIAAITSFLDPALFRRFNVPLEIAA